MANKTMEKKPYDSGPGLGCLLLVGTLAAHALFVLLFALPTGHRNGSSPSWILLVPIATGAASVFFILFRLERKNNLGVGAIFAALSFAISLWGLDLFLQVTR